MSKESRIMIKVMIAGIGGASLGTEILKSLVLAGNYKVFGCDISSTAYGLYDEDFEKTLDINLKAPMILSREAVRDMNDKGMIIQITSTCASEPLRNLSAYSAAKSGISRRRKRIWG